MLIFDINWFAILICMILNMGIGAVWYGPLFGKQWMEELGLSEDDLKSGNPAKDYGFAFLNSFLMAFVMANVLTWATVSNIGTGVFVGLLMWLGFTGFSFGVNHAFENRSIKIWLINSGMYLVGLLVMGAVLVAWS